MSANIPASIQKMLSRCRTLPTLPAVAMQVLDLSQDPDIGAAKIAKVIARDPALAAKILKVANSAWCGIQREITALDQAVSMLGLNGTMGLALSFSLVRGLREVGDKAFDYQSFWRRSVICAAATLSVGTEIQAASRDELFLAGLLQDIGMLVLNQAMPSYGPLVALAMSNHRALVEVEHRELESDHGQVGGWFLKMWHLPCRIVTAIGASHKPVDIKEPLEKSVAIGSYIADIWVNPNTIEATASMTKAAQAMLKLSPDRLNQILAKTAAHLPEVTENLDIRVGDEAFINGLLDQAREAVAELNLRTLQEARKIAAQAQLDALTSLHNRAYLDQILEGRFDQDPDSSQPLTLVFIDIDKFKSVNDTYGHHAGDAVLISISEVIRSAIRNYDTVARFGGDEFVVLLINTDDIMAAEIAERIRSMVAKRLHKVDEDKLIHVTVSVGWATMSQGSNIMTAEELLKAADNSLYAAKTSGRNRVAHAS